MIGYFVLYFVAGAIALAGLNLAQYIIKRDGKFEWAPAIALNLIALPIWFIWAPVLLVLQVRAYRNSAYCLWCGKNVVTPYDKKSALAHIESCSKHPIWAVRAELAKSREQIRDLEDKLSESSQFGRWER